MGKSIERKRKRQFFGNRFTKNRVEVAEQNTASCSKLKVDSTLDSAFLSDKTNETLCGNRIFDLEILSSVFSELCCPNCCSEKVVLVEESRYGLCSHFVLRCEGCSFQKGFASSKKQINLPEVNTRLVYGMRQIGRGFSAAYKLCSTLNLPRLSKTAYTSHEQKLLTVVSEVAEDSMKEAANELVQKQEKLVKKPKKVVKKKKKTSEEAKEIVKCGVSVDGTWQRRGYTSLNGCVAAISIETGKVLDLEVMSSYCPTCKKLEKMEKNVVYDSLKADHVCQCNFEGSSSKMETVGASRIFLRSQSKRQLQYTEYYGDGDSKGFDSVKDAYGDNSVKKLECIGHIQKRVGTRLRKLKSKSKGLSGKGKLTNTFIDRLQNYYGIAIRSNVGDLQKMQQSVIAALFHCASSSKKPMHGQCPLGTDSWCFFQRALAQGKSARVKYAGLPKAVLNAVKPVYLSLCSRELLCKCLHGKTQNANESLNGTIWQRVPKEVFVGLKTLKLGAYDAVVQFNSGYQGCLNVFTKLGIKYPGFYTLQGYKHLDRLRVRDSIRHSVPNSKRRRKILRAIRKKKFDDTKSKEGTVYKSGGF